MTVELGYVCSPLDKNIGLWMVHLYPTCEIERIYSYKIEGIQRHHNGREAYHGFCDVGDKRYSMTVTPDRCRLFGTHEEAEHFRKFAQTCKPQSWHRLVIDSRPGCFNTQNEPTLIKNVAPAHSIIFYNLSHNEMKPCRGREYYYEIRRQIRRLMRHSPTHYDVLYWQYSLGLLPYSIACTKRITYFMNSVESIGITRPSHPLP